MSIIKKLLIVNEKASIIRLLTAFLAIVFIRTFLENISSPLSIDRYTSGYITYLHYPLFYFSVVISLLFAIKLFTKDSIQTLSGIAIKLLPITWLPPIIDLLVTRGVGWQMSYIFHPIEKIGSDFFTFFGPLTNPGVTPGIRIEIILILLTMGFYTFIKTRSLLKIFLVVFFSYSVFFFYATLPSLIAIPFIDSYHNSFVNFYQTLFSQSLLSKTNTMNIIPNNPEILLEQQFDIFMTRIFWIISFFQLFIVFYFVDKYAFKAWIKNLRLERIFYYWIIATIGMLIAYQNNAVGISINNIADISSLIVFFFLIAIHGWLAVLINDKEDVDIDKISNSSRPLIAKTMTLENYKNISIFLILMSLVGAAALSYTVFNLLLLFQLLYYIYSSKPLRLRRHWISSSAILGLCAVVISMSGFFLISTTENFSAFPKISLLIIFIIFAIISNIKDLKDYLGDKNENIMTLPVILGIKKSKIIFFLLITMILLLISFTFSEMLLVTLATIAFVYRLLFSKHYKEKYLFYLFFVYFFIFTLLWLN